MPRRWPNIARSLKINPDSDEAHNNLGNLFDDAGHPDEAMAEYQAALRINPKYVAAHNNLGSLLVELGRFDEAMQQYAAAAQLDPTEWHAPFLTGKLLLKEGRDAEAVPYFKRAVAIEPNNPRVLTFLAQVLASDENPQVRDGNPALLMAAKANNLTGGVEPAMIDALAMAYAEVGQFNDAQQAAQDAVKLATAYDMTNDVAVIRQRLQLYQNRQPFRQSSSPTRRSERTRGKIESPRRQRAQHTPRVRIFQNFPGGKIFTQPRQRENSSGVEKSGEQLCVGAGGGVPFSRRHQHHARPGRGAARQGFQREQNVVDRAKPVRGGDQRRRVQRRNQIARIEILAQRA